MSIKKVIVAVTFCWMAQVGVVWGGSFDINIRTGKDNMESCHAYGASLRSARQAYRSRCGSKPKDCDPSGNQWLCAGEQIGTRSPDTDNTVAACSAWAHSLRGAKRRFAANCAVPRVDCDPLDNGWLCSSENIGKTATASTPVDDLVALIEAQSGGQGLSAFQLPGSGDYYAIPADISNPLTKEKIALGKMLFHDTRFSQNGFSDQAGSWSCATCHHAAAGFKSGIKQGIGEGGIKFGTDGSNRVLAPGFDASAEEGASNKPDIQPFASPTILNTAYQDVMLWNGQFGNSLYGSVNADVPDAILATPGTPKQENSRRLSGLEIQAIAGTGVHRLKFDQQSLLNDAPLYKQLWVNAYGHESTDFLADAGKAIAAFERSVLANQAPFQRWLHGDKSALTRTEVNGGILFFGKAGCSGCHRGPALSSEAGAGADQMFFNVGFADFDISDHTIHGQVSEADSKGRGGFTGRTNDNYRFKIPQLYNLTDTSVLGHGASFSSVRSVIEYKNSAWPQNNTAADTLDYRFVPLGLSRNEIGDLTAFLENALYDPNLARYEPNSVPAGSCIVVDPLDFSSREQCHD